MARLMPLSAVPSAATAGVLVVVGCMMASSLKEIEWGDIARATRLMLAASVCALVVFGAARAAVVLAVGAMA